MGVLLAEQSQDENLSHIPGLLPRTSPPCPDGIIRGSRMTFIKSEIYFWCLWSRMGGKICSSCHQLPLSPKSLK
jgi:hypothetical protein